MKKVFVFILLALSCNSVWAKTLNVEALSDFSTANPSEYLEVKILDTYVTKNDFVIHAGSIVNGKITDVKEFYTASDSEIVRFSENDISEFFDGTLNTGEREIFIINLKAFLKKVGKDLAAS